MKTFVATLGACLVTALVACGGAAPSAASPSEATPSNQAAPESTQAGASNNTRTLDVSTAKGDFERAEQTLSTSQGDCAAACRALASMERAAEHLCQLDAGTECGRARERVEAARERVRSTCGGCGS